MAYTSQLTYGVYNQNATLFLEVVREVLEVEFLNQKNNFGKSFLPGKVQTDEYLLNPIPDKDFDPSWCSVIKAKWESGENQFIEQQNNMCYYIIGIMARGMEDLRKIGDSIYVILNDMNVKQYFFLYENGAGERLISNSGEYLVKSLSTEYEIKKTNNDKDVIYGNLVLQAEILELAAFNETTPLTEIHTTHKLGENLTEVKQEQIL